MSHAPAPRTFEVRHLQLARALFGAIAAIMITFSPDHSAPVGLSVFSGFAIATGFVYFAAAWLVFEVNHRWPAVLMGVLNLAAGMAAGLLGIRTPELFFAVVISWAALTAIVEISLSAHALRQKKEDAAARATAREGLFVGILTAVLAMAIALVPTGYALQYYVAEAGASYTLTGITIAVGVFGGYAAIMAVYLAIAAFSPRPSRAPVPAPTDASSKGVS